jgi:hypothetical protein
MEEGPENGKESLHSAHASGMNESCVTVLEENATVRCFVLQVPV